MTVSDWSDETEGNAWDTLFLGDKVVPGVATVTAKVPDPRDKKKGTGSKRAKTADDGEHLIEFSVTVVITEQAEAQDFFDNIVPLFRKGNKDGSRDPLVVGHPQAYFWNVTAVTVGEINMPSPDSLNGWSISFEMTEWVPEAKAAKPAKPEPQGDVPGRVSNPAPTLAEQALGSSGLG